MAGRPEGLECALLPVEILQQVVRRDNDGIGVMSDRHTTFHVMYVCLCDDDML